MAFLSTDRRSRLTCFRPAKGTYCRIEQIPRLLKLWPRDVDDFSYPGTLKVVDMLRKALRAERARATARHWAYDLNRHLALIAALKEEEARLIALGGGREQGASDGTRIALSRDGTKTTGKAGEDRPSLTLRLPCARESSARGIVNSASSAQ